MIRVPRATQLSCMEQAISSEHADRPLAQAVYCDIPSSASTMYQSFTSAAGTRNAQPPVGPLLERNNPFRASCYRILARKCAGMSSCSAMFLTIAYLPSCTCARFRSEEHTSELQSTMELVYRL